MAKLSRTAREYDARADFHAPGDISWVVLSEFPGYGDFRWEVDTARIPAHLRSLGSKFQVLHEYRDRVHHFEILA